MPLTRGDRFRLKAEITDEFGEPHWSFDRIDMLLKEFKLGPWPRDYDDPSPSDLLADLSDDDLVELYSTALKIDPEEVTTVLDTTDDGCWKPGYVRVFLSHSAIHKEFVGKIADELAVAGIHGFVAHDTMTVSKPWQGQIEAALQSMQAFVALVHPEFNDSAWCHQEIGWALGRRIPVYTVRFGNDPKGFISSVQWPSCHGKTAREVATTISSWIAEQDLLGESIVEGMFSALREAGNYYDAEAAVKRLATLGTLTADQFTELDRIWWSNDQLYGSILATRAMSPFYAANGRPWPPDKEVQ
ncbi:toll/interleukin-1 receptor domain-containing protein [Rhodococcus sp. NPDC003318]|uniref:toll/interleukin-1 receptor domain-containing protein n=1 Tax=Rhodococcus sp. NPDC003318 TaxID=3364503 RepID=UPI00367E25BE